MALLPPRPRGADARTPQGGVRGQLLEPTSASGFSIEGGSGILSSLYGWNSSWWLLSSSWYTDSAFTAQMSWFAPSQMFSTVRIAVSDEWSELLYRCSPLRPIWCRLSMSASQSLMTSTRSAYSASYIG